MSMVEPNLEGFLNQKKQVKNHYFPLVGVLAAGIISFRQGNSHFQMLMRAHVDV
ncbi:hypothetical protein PVL29_022580 [Vitis rotundifolia]|uniref:Uncharacterized protein n=1 Tax=Vitis rotundifolia TaxID=103349 RepID=A0AA39DB61_VITRO|nr:hypothetical protein PVL29_022580 [Vitis rotundifolia]